MARGTGMGKKGVFALVWVVCFAIGFSASEPAFAGIGNGLIVYFSFDTDVTAPGGTVIDESPAGNDGTVVGSNVTYTAQGKCRGAYEFGQMDRIELDDNPTALLPAFAVSLWFKTDVRLGPPFDSSNNLKVASAASWHPHDGSGWVMGTHYTEIWSDDPDSFPINQAGPRAVAFLEGEWNHFVISYDGTTYREYINGDLSQEYVHTPTGPALGLGDHLDVGAWSRVNMGYRGLIDEFRVYNRGLTEADVATLYRCGVALPPQIEALEVFYSGRFGNLADPAKEFLALGQASSIFLVGDDLHGHVTNYLHGVTGIRVKFDTVVAFSAGVAAAFSYQATPEQVENKVFSPFTPPTSPTYVVDDSTGQTVVTIIFADGEIKNRWLKTIIDASQVTGAANGLNLDGELAAPLALPSGDDTAGGNAEFIIGNRFGDVDGNYRCLLNDAVLMRNHVSGGLVGISHVFDVDKNGMVLLNDAVLTRNAVIATALPPLP